MGEEFVTIRIPRKLHLIMKAVCEDEGMIFSTFSYRAVIKGLAELYPKKVRLKDNNIYMIEKENKPT